MSLTAAASGFVIFLLSVPVIQGQDDGWGVTYTSTEICAFKGSTVNIRCSYTYPSRENDRDTRVRRIFWFTKDDVDLRTDQAYSRRAQHHCENNHCTLRITDLRESDSAEYKFKFITNQPGGRFTGSPGVSLSVTDLQVEVGRSLTQAELKCQSSCDVADHPSYVWYNNGQEIDEETSSHRVSVDDNGRYSCAVKGHEEYRSPPVYNPKRPLVSVSPSGEIVEGSSVTLTCSSDANPAANYTWDKKNENFKPLSEEPQLVFSSIQSSDSGQYYCTAQNELGERTSRYVSIDVKYAPKRPSVSVSPSGEIVEGRSVTLTCSSDANPAAKYTWYKDGKLYFHPLRKEPQQLVFSSIQSSDSGGYYCTAENELGERTTEYISINVKYPPKRPSVSVSPSGEIVEGSSVTLSCSSDANPAAKYTWYKNGNLKPLSEEPQLVFSSIQSSDSGQYYCTAQNELGERTSRYFSIDVKYAPKRPSVSVSPSGEIVEGRSVTLTCSSDANPAAKYTWYKDGKLYFHPLRKEPQQLVFSSIQSSDSGGYYCKAENELGERTTEYISINVKYPPKRPSVSVSPSGEIVEGSSVTLSCSSDANPAAGYTWYKKNQTLLQGPEGIYHFTSISSEDSGIYYCKSDNQHGEIMSLSLSVDVQYPPKRPSVSVSPSGEIVEGSSVTLSCSSDANPAAGYTWYKKNQTLLQGPEGIYHFTSISSEDSGIYYCKSDNQHGEIMSLSLSVDVQYPPKRPSVSVSPSGEIVEGSSVTLSCSSDANPAAGYTWYKKNQTLLQGPEGIYHFTSISSEDRGIYYCKSDNQHGEIMSLSLSVDVQYPPKHPSVSVSPSDELEEGNSVTLTCSSDANPAANYTWDKKNENFKPLRKEPQLVFSPIQSSDSGEYYCTAENELGRTSGYISIDVKYAPKHPSVSVSPSGEIVEGSSVTLTCSSDANPAARYTWYKNGNLKPLREEPQHLILSSIQSSDSGEYYCIAENDLRTMRSKSIFINVNYGPKRPSVSVSPSGEIVEGRSVTLTCSTDANPAANYTWYKENQTLLQGPEGIYHFTSISSEDRGTYYCKSANQHGEINSTSLSVDVQYAPKLPSVSVSPSGDIVEGSSVNLTCSSDANPAANYTWYKENEDSPETSGQIFTITDFRAEHSGNYYCEAQNNRGRHNSTLHLTVVAGAWKLIAAAATGPAAFLTIIFVSVILWVIKKTSSKQPPEPRERPGNREQMPPAEQQDELHYASVHFSRRETDPLYSNIRPAQPRRYKEERKEEEEEEMVVYAAVRFNSVSPSSRGQEASEDPAALYSTVNKNWNL